MPKNMSFLLRKVACVVKKQCREIRLRGIKLLNILLVAVPIVICWYCCYADQIYIPFYRKGNWVVIALFLLVYQMFARVYDALRISQSRISEMIYSQSLSLLLADTILFAVTWLLMRRFPALFPALVTLVAQLSVAVLWSLLANRWYFREFPPRKTAVVYSRQRNLEALIHQYGMEKKYQVYLTLDADRCAEDPELLADAEIVFISDASSHARNAILKYCVEHNKEVFCLPRIGDIIMSGARKMHMFHLPILQVSRYQPSLDNVFLKRTFDILSSALVLLITSPIFAVTAIAIKLTDGGPVFYRQNRLTRNGKVFQVLKFRSMRVDAEKDGVARLSTGDKDPRITPVGRIIRKLRIDELPQLLNILEGSMSVVGPRPERPEIAAQYEEILPEFRLRLQVKAGLTGYAQVYGKYNTTPYDKLQMDLMYIANPSIVEDIRIILATVKILFQPESTEGVAEGQATAQQVQEEQTPQPK